jgi:hypothetical protein
VGAAQTLLPSLRADISEHATAAAAAAAAGGGGGHLPRTYLACVVRLSPEKEPERFVALVEALVARGALQRRGVVPFLLAAADTVSAPCTHQHAHRLLWVHCRGMAWCPSCWQRQTR